MTPDSAAAPSAPSAPAASRAASRAAWHHAAFRARLPLDGLARAPTRLRGRVSGPFGIGRLSGGSARLFAIVHLPSCRVLGWAVWEADARAFAAALARLPDELPGLDWTAEFPEAAAEADPDDAVRALRIRHGVFTTIGTEMAP